MVRLRYLNKFEYAHVIAKITPVILQIRTLKYLLVMNAPLLVFRTSSLQIHFIGTDKSDVSSSIATIYDMHMYLLLYKLFTFVCYVLQLIEFFFHYFDDLQ